MSIKNPKPKPKKNPAPAPSAAPAAAVPAAAPAPAAQPGELDMPKTIVSLCERVTELEGDLTRIVDLLVKGDLDAAKFREILAKRQGKA